MKPQQIAVEQADFASYDALIDTRSPAEYAEDHIPGALSAPVLDDGERAQVGTLYKQVSQFDAQKLGAALLARNVARHVETLFSDKPKTWRPLVYCWRGGKRSGAMAQILREIGWDAKTLEGGYKAYRRWVVEQLQALPPKYTFTVIHGPTGSGKSRLLAALARAGGQILDRELLAALGALDASRAVFVEGESKKIGQLQIPDALMSAMRASACVKLEAGVETRVTLLMEEYRHFLADRAALEAQLDCLVALHGRERIAEWKALGARGEFREGVRRLLLEHYDPAYKRSSHRNFVHLAGARQLRIASADEAAFAQAANALLNPEEVAA